MPPGFYNPYDQQVYDAGFKFIPQSKFLINPFQIPQDSDSGTGNTQGGLPTLNVGGGGGGGALQAGDINYDSFAKAGFDAYANRQPTPLVDDLYQSKVDKTFMGFPSYRQQELTGPDMGEYIGSGTDIPLELTRAGKIQESLGGIKEGLGSLTEKFKGIGPISAILGSIDKFDTLPALDQQFIKQSMGYRGPTVFGENTGGGYVDPFGVNVRSAFGNYAEKVRDDFSSLGDSLSGRLSEKYGVSFDPKTGMFVGEDEEAVARANKMTKMMRAKYTFRQKQIQQQEFDKKIAAQKEKARLAEIERIKNLGKGPYDPGVHGSTDYGRGSDGQQSYSGDAIGAGNLGFGVGATTGGPVSNKTGRGRQDYMDGGIVDMLEIYD
jgi:hypothetical protein